MITMKVVVLISVFVFNTGFLLKDQNPQQSGSVSNQYPSMAKYLADQSSMHQELETLRRQQEMSMNLLTSQLEQKLVEMEAKIPEQSSRNDTCKVLYEKLEQNVQEVTQNNTRLVGDLETLHHRYNLLNRAFENTTTKLENSLQELKKLKNIQQLQSLNNLNEKIQKIDSSINSLRSHEQARNQDFLALYNLTIQSESAIDRMSKYQKEMNYTITELRNVSNKDFLSLYNLSMQSESATNRKMDQFQTDLQRIDKQMNNKITVLQQDIDNKVALTACSNGRKQVGSMIKFTDIRTSIGTTNQISNFTSTGKFICFVDGLYHISLVLTSMSRNHLFHIYKNTNIVANGWMDNYYSPSSENYWRSAAAVTATWLHVGDTVKATTAASDDIGASQSACITIVRIN